MADNENSKHSGYELDLDDTISSWDEVVEEAVAAVGKKSVREAPEGEAGDGASVAADDADEPSTTAAEALGNGEESAPEGSGEDDGPPEKNSETEDSTEVRNLRDQLVRTLADFDNFRKRTEREKATMKRYALFDVLKDFLDVHDNLERALAASGNTEDLKKGVEMIARQFFDLLRRYGVEPVEAVGESFDPSVHEAVAREEGEEIDEPTVVSELQRGYRLHDRLLRPAMVSVAMPAPPEPPPDPASGDAAPEEDDAAPEEDGAAPEEDGAAPEDAAPRGERGPEEELGETVTQTTEVN